MINGIKQIVFHAYESELSNHAQISASRIMAWLEGNNTIRTGIEQKCVEACKVIAKSKHYYDAEDRCYDSCVACIAQKALEEK